MEQSLPVLPPHFDADPLIKTVLRVWNRARGTDLAAPRPRITMRDLGPCLPWFVIAEEETPDRFVYRLVGTRVREITGSDHTWATVEEFTPPEMWAARQKRLQLMLNTPCGMVTEGRFRQANGRTVGFRSICLPVSDVGSRNHRGFVIQNSLPEDYRFDLASSFRDFSIPQQTQFIDIGAGLPPA